MSANAEFVCDGCDGRAIVQCEFADDIDDFELEWGDRHRDCIPMDRSVVRALTADFTDHSRPGCGCGARDSGFSQAQAVAQAEAGRTASATNFRR